MSFIFSLTVYHMALFNSAKLKVVPKQYGGSPTESISVVMDEEPRIFHIGPLLCPSLLSEKMSVWVWVASYNILK